MGMVPFLQSLWLGDGVAGRTLRRDWSLIRAPWHRLRRAGARMMAPAGDFAIVQALARGFGIRDVTVAGEFGFVQGSIHDTAILAAYACTKTWRPAFAHFFS